jgi:GNAT superfamily N-acetyltransferase
MSAGKTKGEALRIRRVRADDMRRVTTLDKRVTGVGKNAYWRDIFARYGKRRTRERFFLIAEPATHGSAKELLGFIIGEVRAWEFGSAPCGWIFALAVEQGARLRGVGEALFEAISVEFASSGVTKVRTMVERSDRLPMLFFRGAGMAAGPYIQLEMDLP